MAHILFNKRETTFEYNSFVVIEIYRVYVIYIYFKGGSSIATSMVLEESPTVCYIAVLQIIIYYYHVYCDCYICIDSELF